MTTPAEHSPQEITVQWKLREQDVRAGYRTYCRHYYAMGWRFYISAPLATAGLMGMAAGAQGFALLMFAFAGMAFVWLTWKRYYSIRSQLQKSRAFWGAISLTFGTHGIVCCYKHGSSSTTWERFHRVVEGKDVFLLVYGRGLYTLVPKHILATDQVSRLRTMLAEKIGPIEMVGQPRRQR